MGEGNGHGLIRLGSDQHIHATLQGATLTGQFLSLRQGRLLLAANLVQFGLKPLQSDGVSATTCSLAAASLTSLACRLPVFACDLLHVERMLPANQLGLQFLQLTLLFSQAGLQSGHLLLLLDQRCLLGTQVATIFGKAVAASLKVRELRLATLQHFVRISQVGLPAFESGLFLRERESLRFESPSLLAEPALVSLGLLDLALQVGMTIVEAGLLIAKGVLLAANRGLLLPQGALLAGELLPGLGKIGGLLFEFLLAALQLLVQLVLLAFEILARPGQIPGVPLPLGLLLGKPSRLGLQTRLAAAEQILLFIDGLSASQQILLLAREVMLLDLEAIDLGLELPLAVLQVSLAVLDLAALRLQVLLGLL